MIRVMISYQCDTQEEAQTVLSAVAEATGKKPHACSKRYVEPEEIVEGTKSVMVVDRENVNPGEPSIGKIGSGTKEALLGMLNDGHQPPAKWEEHLKLLWSRGEIKFDGYEYYL